MSKGREISVQMKTVKSITPIETKKPIKPVLTVLLLLIVSNNQYHY